MAEKQSEEITEEERLDTKKRGITFRAFEKGPPGKVAKEKKRVQEEKILGLGSWGRISNREFS